MNLTNPAYELLKEEALGDIHSHGYLLCHKKSGARIMFIENDDENKVFSITFRTPPKDSTGVAHILEHSVLCGSERFPLKDPFVELVKGSLNTFLNAMTFPDKTMYPVASCNDQDFQNLMHVYLDAVFFPNIYHREEIFRQEGWSYHLDDPDGELTCNGVVYNEMKGVFSSPDELLERKTMDILFPDTPYGVESGGDPLHIPDLTYEQFLDFHREYYHPSNSYIYFYGNLDIDGKLEFLDREYLSRFDAREVRSEIPLQKPFAERKRVELSYPVLESENTEESTYFSCNAVVGDSLDVKLGIAFQVLDYALLSAPGAPLKKTLLERGIGKDIYGGYDDGIYQPCFHVVAKNAKYGDFDRFCETVAEVLREQVSSGIDKKALEAGINSMEFRFREADYSTYPRGLMYGIDVFSSWLYDENQPFSHLKLLDIFAELRGEISTGYYERLVERYLLENTHVSCIRLCPEKGLTAKQDRETAAKIAAYRDTLTDDERRELAERTRALEAYQESEDSPEALASIPLLSRRDIGRDAGRLFNKETWVDDTLLLHHEVETNGIAYLNLYFDFGQLPEELRPYVGILKSVLGYVDTEHYAYGELFNEINANTGGIQCGTEFFQHRDETKNRAFFGVRAKALCGRLEFVMEMIGEILLRSSLEDDRRLYEIIAGLKSRMQTGIPGAGHSSAVQRALSYISPVAWIQEQTGGIALYQFVEDLETHFEERKEELCAKLRDVMDRIFFRENLTVSFTGDAETCGRLAAEVRRLKELLPGGERPEDRAPRGCCGSRNEGFMTAGQVQYVAQAGDFVRTDESYTGALQILRQILSYDYLWLNLRVKGGAYGCMSGFKRFGESYFVSYRDPNLKNTLDVYRGIPDYLREFTADEEQMTKYIIGTISVLDIPKTPKMKGQGSNAAYFTGVTEEQLQRERDQILDASEEDIRALAVLVENILDSGTICVIGGEEAVRGEEALFDEIRTLIA